MPSPVATSAIGSRTRRGVRAVASEGPTRPRSGRAKSGEETTTASAQLRRPALTSASTSHSTRPGVSVGWQRAVTVGAGGALEADSARETNRARTSAIHPARLLVRLTP